MCVAFPGKIIQINGNTAEVMIHHNTCQVNISLISPKVGDYVLIHAGCALEVLSKSRAEELIELFSELEKE